MKIIDPVPASFPDDVKAQIQEALDDIAKGIRRPEKIKAACEHMDRIREENRKLFGETAIAVELIRQTRDQACTTCWTAVWLVLANIREQHSVHDQAPAGQAYPL